MMPYNQEAVDPLDIDEYLDFNQGGRGSPASSTASSHTKRISTPEQTTPRPRQSLMKPANPPNVFAGPSHQYDLHKQQTGLPVGGLASTIAASRQAGFPMQSFANNNFGLQNAEEMFDFNAMPSNPPAFSGMAEMDVDFGSPVDGMVGPADGGEFVDPHNISGASPPLREAVRMYPGMHTQQAALAKQRQQQEIQRQQQMKSAQSLPQQAPAQPAHRRDSSQRSNGSNKATDPMVEERISRLLNQMRQGSSNGSDDISPNSTQTHFPRSKKPEEEMDEDERLLASEEGKKLSSKERRQLRNKVSARAFRSRRKEYISQLEGEITSKAQENDDLRAENEALRSENMRLTDLSKMLLSSPAFSNFLNDLSANGMPGLPQAIANQQQQSLARQMQQQQQQQAPKPQPPKDVNPHQSQLLLQQQQQQQQQQQMQGGNMSTISESEMDLSNLDANGSWGVGMDFGFDAQVFQVTELPPEPLSETPVDVGLLSGKGSGLDVESKLDLPAIESTRIPAPVSKVTPVVDESVEFDESNPAYALFADDATPSFPSKPTNEDAEAIFGAIPIEKALAHINLIVVTETESGAQDGELSTANMARIEALQSQLHELSSRLASYMP